MKSKGLLLAVVSTLFLLQTASFLPAESTSFLPSKSASSRFLPAKTASSRFLPAKAASFLPAKSASSRFLLAKTASSQFHPAKTASSQFLPAKTASSRFLPAKTASSHFLPAKTASFLEAKTASLPTKTASSWPHPTKTASFYDALLSHGLPMGLFPKGVENYTLSDDGRFEVHLEQACNAKFESELHYDRNVTGRLSYGEIADLAGVAAQELFLWFPVRKIRVDVPSSGLIYFDVGVVFKQFSVSMFETPPECVAGALPPEVVAGEGVVNDLLKQVGESTRHPVDHGESRSESI